MSSLNKVILMGNITADPELKQTQSGTSVCSFSIAVNRRFEKDKVDFITCVAWKQHAEFITRYFKKGQCILVVGNIQVRTWTDKNGGKRYETEVIVDEVAFAGAKTENSPSTASSAHNPTENPQEYVPDAYAQPIAPSAQFEEIPNDDSLPF